MPTSKLTRVRVEDFSKTMPSVFFASGSWKCRAARMRLSSEARFMRARISSAEKSHSESRSRFTRSRSGERMVERGHALVELGVGHDERRHQAHHGAAGDGEHHAPFPPPRNR